MKSFIEKGPQRHRAAEAEACAEFHGHRDWKGEARWLMGWPRARGLGEPWYTTIGVMPINQFAHASINQLARQHVAGRGRLQW